jgi:hypothetical protein
MKSHIHQSFLLLVLLSAASFAWAQRPCNCSLPITELSDDCKIFCNAQAANPAFVPDSTIIPASRLPQHKAFASGTYNYPAKPRTYWEAGIKLGTVNIVGDLSSVVPGKSFGVHLRKALGYAFSLRLAYNYSIAYGLSTDRERNYSLNPAWRMYSGQRVFYNYRTEMNDLALEGIMVIDNVQLHRSKVRVSPYGLMGIGLTAYQARINTLDEDGKIYNFGSIPANYSYKIRKEVLHKLRDLLDDTYETAAENEGTMRPKFLGVTAIPVLHVGAGFAFRLNDRLNIALENRISITRSDLLDGKQWTESTPGNPVHTKSHDIYNNLTLGLNVNLGGHASQPLWWTNPLDYSYGELRNPAMMRLPRLKLPDADGDGITDQLDLEQTPAGVPVDTRGISRDTDGDGVPDALDKELITPGNCQPVDANGVGKCPCPEGCGGAK